MSDVTCHVTFIKQRLKDYMIVTPGCHHPGETLRARLEAVKQSVTAAARQLGVTRKCLSELLNGRFGVSPEMALRLAAGFPDTTPQFWLDLQTQWDLQLARQKLGTLDIKPFSENSRHA